MFALLCCIMLLCCLMFALQHIMLKYTCYSMLYYVCSIMLYHVCSAAHYVVLHLLYYAVPCVQDSMSYVVCCMLYVVSCMLYHVCSAVVCCMLYHVCSAVQRLETACVRELSEYFFLHCSHNTTPHSAYTTTSMPAPPAPPPISLCISPLVSQHLPTHFGSIH